MVLNGAFRIKSKVDEWGMQSMDKSLLDSKGLVAPVLLYTPVFSIFLKFLNSSVSSHKKSCSKMMQSDITFSLTPGGMEEMSLYQ